MDAALIERFCFDIAGVEFRCSKSQALFLSPAVERILAADSTVDRFRVNEDVAPEFFDGIRSLMEGRSIILTEENCIGIWKIASALENEELLRKCAEFVEKGELSVENCVNRLKTKEEFGCPLDEELEFVAKHFYEVDTEELRELKQETIESIVSHEELCLEDEESLLEFVGSLGEDYSSLYGYVECRFLSLEGIETFLGRVDGAAINQRVWSSVCRRLRCELSGRELYEPRFRGSCPYVEGHEFEGIIHDLTAKYGGNVHEKGIVNITSSGDGRNKPYQVADHDWNDAWHSTRMQDAWICFDFKRQRLALSHYTLRSGGSSANFPVSWVLEGSNDGTNWTGVDSRNTQELKDNHKVKTFESSQNRSRFFRYFRLKHVGRDSSDQNHLVLASVEFFGNLREVESA
jgi:hypothetical protein